MDFNAIPWPDKVFVTGIGTDVGKSFATGWLAREMRAAGINVITQKFIQTGNVGESEDIARHRSIMGIPMQDADVEGLTAPVIFSFPASPLLAAAIDNRELDLSVIDKASDELLKTFSNVLIEGAGGVMVPLKENYLTIDYVRDRNLPAIVVTNGKLGSVSDTLLTLYALKNYGIRVLSLIYNPFFDEDATICNDTKAFLKEFLANHFPDSLFMMMPAGQL